MPRLSPGQRHYALGLVRAGLSYSEVARRMECAQSTIRRLIEREEETGSVNDRPRAWGQCVTTPEQDRHIRLVHLRDRFRTAAQTARETPGLNNNRVSESTVRRHLRANNMRAIAHTEGIC